MKKWKEDITLVFGGFKMIRRLSPGLLALVLLQSAFMALSPFLPIYMSAKIIDGIAGNASLKELLFMAAATVTASLAVHLLASALQRLVSIRRQRFWYQYEMTLSRKMMEMDFEDVESARIHQLRQQMEDLWNMTGDGLPNILYQFQEMTGNLFTLVFSISFVAALFTASYEGHAFGVLAFAASPLSSLLLVLLLFANAFAGMVFGKKMTLKSHLLLQNAADSNRIYGYFLENHIMNYHTGKDVRIYSEAGLLREEAARQYNVGEQMVSAQIKNEAKYTGATAFFTVALSAFIYLFAGFRALAGMISAGNLVLYIGSISRFTNGFTGFATALTRLRTNNEAMKLLFAFLDTPSRLEGSLPGEPGQPSKNMPKLSLSEEKGKGHEVEFQDVSFRYPDSENWVLRHLNLKFQTGKHLAVVGRNGSGKTTFIKLLCRLYDPAEGRILIDGKDIRTYDLEAYRNLFSVVFQDYKLLSFSLAQNVAAGSCADPLRVSHCLEQAGFSMRLNEMPSGIDTCLYKDFEKDGVELSGGEAQKIALARALYKDAPIMVLDEPTAALDPVAESEIFSRFHEIVDGKTAIYISHRLSSCQFCDDILVFHDGKIVQRGTHKELTARKEGVYYELWNAQAQHYA